MVVTSHRRRRSGVLGVIAALALVGVTGCRVNGPPLLLSWGSNSSGQVGDGLAPTDRQQPYMLDADWSVVAAGYEHTLAVRNDGTLWGWGRSSSTELGTCCTSVTSTPTQIGTSTWKTVAAGQATIGIRNDGSLWGWGGNAYGEDGTGSSNLQDYPTQLGTAKNWMSVSAQDANSGAIRGDGTLWLWGYNGAGEIGNGTHGGQQSTPLQVGTATNWRSVSVGDQFTLGIRTDGTLWAWGGNNRGQLGDGTTSEHDSPEQIGAATNWVSVSAGGGSTVAMRSDGSLWAWGDNTDGQVGDGTIGGLRMWPEQIGYTGDWKTAGTGQAGVVWAIRTDGTLWTWGTNQVGQVGDGSQTDRPVPTEIGSAATWKSATVGGGHVVATGTDATLWSWGYNSNGQVGNGTSGGNVLAPALIGPAHNWKAVSAGQYHTVIIRTDGSLWAWGDNAAGELGDGTTVSQNTPERIGTATTWQSVSAGFGATFAIQANGTLWGWGTNGYGQLGDGASTTISPTPEEIGYPYTWKSVSTNGFHALAIRSDGTLWAWGYNFQGQLGDGSTTNQISPEQIGSATTWASVSAGLTDSVATRTDGTLWAWGDNSFGQLGDGTTAQRDVPTQVGTATNWQSASAGDSHTLALRTDGTLWTWGDNESGQLGDGTTSEAHAPEHIGTSTWKSVAAGYGFSVAIRNDGSLWAWGANGDYELADGSTTNRPSPEQIGTSTDWTLIAAGGGQLIGVGGP